MHEFHVTHMLTLLLTSKGPLIIHPPLSSHLFTSSVTHTTLSFLSSFLFLFIQSSPLNSRNIQKVNQAHCYTGDILRSRGYFYIVMQSSSLSFISLHYQG